MNISDKDDQALRSRIDALLADPGEKDQDDDREDDDAPGDEESQETGDDDTTLGLSDEDLIDTDQDEDEDQDQETDEEDDQETGEPLMTAKELAEKLGVGVKDVYEIKFPYGRNGESLSLGELKDVGIRARDLDSQTTQLDIDREAHTNDKMVSRAEMQNIISLMPEIPQQLVDQAKAQYRNVVNQERISLLSTIPAWSDPAKERTDRDAILVNLRTYGFTEVEMNHMLDHRLVKLLDDYTRLKGKLVKPKADIKAMAAQKGGRKALPPGKRKRAANRKRANEIGRTGNTRGAINALLGE